MKCFVIQPFTPTYDARFADTFEPAILAAGMTAYRVDQDAGVSIPIEEIESNISSAFCCFADITEDNPNVWFELGYAIALKKQICIVCSDERKTKFPFDVQHRSIIKYATKSRSDFTKLEASITRRLQAIAEKSGVELVVSSVTSPIKTGSVALEQHELACLAILAGELLAADGVVSVELVRDAMGRSGYNSTATALALHNLQLKGLITRAEASQWNGDTYAGFGVMIDGYEVLSKLTPELVLTQAAPTRTTGLGADKFPLNDDIPF